MSEQNKAILQNANAAITNNDHEGFLAHCADDVVWMMVGESTLNGNEAVRQWMATEYKEPPKFEVSDLIAEGDFVVACGEITLKDKAGKAERYSYSDVWRFRGDKMVELRAFVVKTPGG